MEDQQKSDTRVTKALAEALREVFGENIDSQRFIDVSRIPMICKSIYDIHSNIKDIKDMMRDNDSRYVNQDQFTPIRQVVFGLVALILTSVVVALLSLIIKNY